jgi:ferric-dicitrate binding protein FerR (iron transport regulator)
MDDDRIDWERLDRFIRGVGQPAERAALERWVDADPIRRKLADAMRSVGSRNPEQLSRWDGPAALRRLEQQRASARGARAARPGARSAPDRWRRLPRTLVTAGVAAAALVAGVFFRTRYETRARTVGAQPARDIVTAAGQRGLLHLSDGTRVVLSAESHLRISGDFGDVRKRRAVWLEGEAFFSVRHDSTRSFVVNTSLGSAEDLGTEFVVSTYPEVNGMRVAVREGRVAIHPNAAPARKSTQVEPGISGETVAILGKGDVALLSASGALDVSRAQNLASLFAGNDGSIVLDATPLRDAIPRLERWYGIRIHVREATLLSRRVSGMFRDEPATEALGVIAIALECKARWNRNEVTLVSH